MSFSFCSFSSGSSGNCYLVKTRKTALLVDAGISTKRILAGLAETGTAPEQVQGLLITHEHADHVKSIGTLSKKLPHLHIYANENTWNELNSGQTEVLEEKRRVFEKEEQFQIGDIMVKAFAVSHDAADPVGFSFYHGEKQISIVTDTGYISEEILQEISGAKILILEANHDIEMLKFGRYPWFLKQRVLGPEGHLSNIAAGEAILHWLAGNVQEDAQDELECTSNQPCVILAHLSRENNFPEMAYQTIKNILEENEFYIGKHISVSTLVRDELSNVFSID